MWWLKFVAKILHTTDRKRGQTLEQAAHGGCWVTVSGDVQEICRCGTKEYGLVGNTGRWLD